MSAGAKVESVNDSSSGSARSADVGNARKKGGPRTQHGKKIASQNARKHGYYSKVLPFDEYFFSKSETRAFKRIFTGLIEDRKPEGMAEKLEVELAALALWQYWRLLHLQQAVFMEGRLPLSDRKDIILDTMSAPAKSEVAGQAQPDDTVDDCDVFEERFRARCGIDLYSFEEREEESERLNKMFSRVPKQFSLLWLQKYQAQLLRQYYRAMAELGTRCHPASKDLVNASRAGTR